MFDIDYSLLLRWRELRVYSVNTMTEEKHIETALISEIAFFCERHQLAFTTFGRRFLNNPNFYDDLLDGRSPTGKTLKKLKTRMKNENIKLRGKKNVESK